MRTHSRAIAERFAGSVQGGYSGSVRYSGMSPSTRRMTTKGAPTGSWSPQKA